MKLIQEGIVLHHFYLVRNIFIRNTKLNIICIFPDYIVCFSFFLFCPHSQSQVSFMFTLHTKNVKLKINQILHVAYMYMRLWHQFIRHEFWSSRVSEISSYLANASFEHKYWTVQPSSKTVSWCTGYIGHNRSAKNRG